MSKLPFNRAIFWKVFITVMVLVVLTFVILFWFTKYQLTTADTYGSLISAVILSYLVHLWLLPPEYLPEEESDPEPEEDDGEGETGTEESPEVESAPAKPNDQA